MQGRNSKRNNAGRTMICLLDGDQVLALPCAPLDLSRIVRRLQIVGDGDDW